MSATTITVRLDSDLKSEASDVLNNIGLDLSTSIKLFLRQTVLQRRLPVELRAEDFITEKLGKVLLESKNDYLDRANVPFETADDMFESLDK
ncbi:MAG: type II toxin-antitoxin system RelB/DinJ family antitoxin [Candidatus Ancillula sp.]|nr:type II toxin-antitoxin system RelB/DinJ family antitoxin [Candidatus Ancillula sp.]